MTQREKFSPSFLSEQELSARFGLSRRYWQMLRQNGEGPPYYKFGRRCLYREDEVQEWALKHRIATSQSNDPFDSGATSADLD